MNIILKPANPDRYLTQFWSNCHMPVDRGGTTAYFSVFLRGTKQRRKIFGEVTERLNVPVLKTGVG